MIFNDPPSLFYLASALVFALFAFFSSITFMKAPSIFPRLLSFCALTIFILRALSMIASWYKPYEAYSSHLSLLVFSCESIMILVLMTMLKQAKINQDSATIKLKDEALAVFERLSQNKASIAYAWIWNLMLLVITYFNNTLSSPLTKRAMLIFVICSYWFTANSLYKKSIKLQDKMVQEKFDKALVALTMMGFIVLTGIAFPSIFVKYSLVFEGSLYFFEVIAVFCLSKGVPESKKNNSSYTLKEIEIV